MSKSIKLSELMAAFAGKVKARFKPVTYQDAKEQSSKERKNV